MDRWRGFLARLRALFASGAAHEQDEELRLHLEMSMEANARRGLSGAEARRQALLAFGGEDRFREELRDVSGFTLLDELRQDVRVALRMLRRSPQFTVAAVLTLALGIGASTAFFSVLDAVLLRASPHQDPDRLVMIWETDRDSETSHEPASWPDLLDMRERSRTLADIAAVVALDAALTEAGEAERVTALGVTSNLPAVLGVAPLLGRRFTPADAASGEVVLLGEEFWRRRYGADPAVVGRQVLLNGRSATVIGVLPAAADLGIAQVHAHADYAAPLASPQVELWVAMQPSAEEFPRQTHPFLAIGRLAPGIPLESAQSELARIMAGLEATFPENAARGVNLEPYADVTFGAVRPALLLLIGAVTLVLLVACVNVANLLLARGAARSREIAVRRAVGASTARITRQYLVESAVLTTVGTLLGLVIAGTAVRLLLAFAPTDIPRLAAAAIDLRVIGFAAAVALLVTLAFALLPLVQTAGIELQQVLRLQPGRRVSQGREARRFQRGLVIAEVALAVPLVIGAGVLLRSFGNLRSVDPGFRTSQVLKAQYQLPDSRYPLSFDAWPELPAINGFHADLLRRVRALPGVTAAAIAARHPLDPGVTNSFVVIGREAEATHWPEIRCRFVTPGYLETTDVPLLSGRAFADGDVAGAAPVVMINRAAAERYFAGREPLGQVLSFWGVPWQIIGVIGDERFNGLDAAPEPAVYAPLGQAPQQAATLLVRTTSPPAQLIAPVRQVLEELDPQVPLYGVEPLERTLAASIARPRFTSLLLTGLGGLGMALALIGVYGVLSYSTAQRSSEIGIRMALGASRISVIARIMREGAFLAAAGAALGATIALVGSRLLESLVFGVSARDPLSFLGVPAAVLLMATLASLIPARRAARADPAATLRAD
jgi:putative ABC transport system permease protein